MKSLSIAALLLTGLLGSTPARGQVNPEYRVDYIGPASSVHAINARGDCVGRQIPSSGNRQGWVSLDGQPLQILPLPPGMILSEAFDINGHGQIVGEVGDGVTYTHAATWLPNGGGGYTVQLLGSLPGMSHGSARTLNDRGDIVGFGIMWNGGQVPALFAPTGNVDLYASYGFGELPEDVNELRQVIGINDRLDLGTGFLEHNTFLLRMRATNESGQLAGTVPNNSQNLHAARFTPGTGLEILSTAQTTSPATIAYGINERGDVVFHPASVHVAGVGSSYVYDLLRTSDRGWSFGGTQWDMDINDTQQIVMLASNSVLGVGGAVRLTPLGMVRGYCTAKVNSQGCTPTMSWSGVPSASDPAPFHLTASAVINGKNGILFYGFAKGSVPFQGGLKCVASPTRRTPVQSSAGNPPPDDCSGSFTYDMNARIQSGRDAGLVGGEDAFCQYWYRDPASPGKTGLTDAVRFTIRP